jgi:hypothetical protein
MITFPIGVAVHGLDRVSAPMRKISGRIEQAFAPLRKLKAGVGDFVKTSGLDRVAAGFGGVASAATDAGAAIFREVLKITAVIGAAAAGLFAITKGYAEAGEGAVRAADQIGISVEALQELRYAAELSNVEQSELETGLTQLQRRVGLVAQGNKGAAVGFERLGISVRRADGSLMGADELLGVIAQRMGELDDPVKRVALAQQLFGKSGAAMLPLLREGAGGIAKLRQEAREAGLVLSEEAARGGDEFMDGLTRMKGTLLGVRNTIGAELMPVVGAPRPSRPTCRKRSRRSARRSSSSASSCSRSSRSSRSPSTCSARCRSSSA